MKKTKILAMALLLLFFLTGCSNKQINQPNKGNNSDLDLSALNMCKSESDKKNPNKEVLLNSCLKIANYYDRGNDIGDTSYYNLLSSKYELNFKYDNANLYNSHPENLAHSFVLNNQLEKAKEYYTKRISLGFDTPLSSDFQKMENIYPEKKLQIDAGKEIYNNLLNQKKQKNIQTNDMVRIKSMVPDLSTWPEWKQISDKLDNYPVINCVVNDKDINTYYQGECLNGRAHGLGRAIGRDTYIGYFNNGVKEGKGLYIYDVKKNYYNGTLKNDLREGFGHGYREYCSSWGFLACKSWSTDNNKGIFSNGKFVRSCNSENGCKMLQELQPKIDALDNSLKCEDAKKIYTQLSNIGEGYFNYDSCVDRREYNKILDSSDSQSMYLKAIKYENNGERSRAKRIYLTIMDKFSKSSIAIQAGNRLAALSDVEAVEDIASSRRSQNSQQCENAKKACIAGCGSFISGADNHNSNMFQCKNKCEEISCY